MKVPAYLRLLTGLIIIAATAVQAASTSTPEFADYPAVVSVEKLQRVDLDSHPLAKTFRTRLQALEGRVANFAGHYLVQTWGCGSSCQQFAIVDVRTGQVFMDEDWSTSLGVCHNASSTLLIANPGALAPGRIESVYYHWDGSQLSLLWQGQGQGQGQGQFGREYRINCGIMDIEG